MVPHLKAAWQRRDEQGGSSPGGYVLPPGMLWCVTPRTPPLPFHHSLLPMGLQYTQYTSQLAPETLVLGDRVSVPDTNLAPAC